MRTFKVKLDRGNKYTNKDCNCDSCNKLVPAMDNMWEASSYTDDNERMYEIFYFCSKKCLNFFILKEM